MLSKTNDFRQMRNMFSKIDDFIKMMNLLSKTGLGSSGHDWSQSFGLIWHVSGTKIVFWRNDIMIMHGFCWRSLKITLFYQKTLIFDKRSKNTAKI